MIAKIEIFVVVSGVTFTDNTASGCQQLGVLITQSYPVSRDVKST
jgi:polygalacturonase